MRHLLLWIFLLYAVPGQAQRGGTVQFRAEPAHATTGLRDVLEVTYTIVDAPRLASLTLQPSPDFIILPGQFDRERTTTDITPSGPVKSTTLSRTFTMQARRTGRFPVPGAVARTADGRVFRSNAPAVSIIPGSAPAPQGASPATSDPFGNPSPGMNLPDPFAGIAQGVLPPGFDPWERVVPTPGGGGRLPTRAELPGRLFLEILPEKRTAYVGEPVTVRYRLTGSVNASGSLTKLPTPDGFWVQDLPTERTAPSDTSIRGQWFQSLLLKRAAFIPQHGGTITIDPAEMEATTDVANAGSVERAEVHLKSAPVSLTVKPLPGGAPKGFSGAVGNFSISAQLDHHRIGADGSAVLTITVRGGGNITQIDAPAVAFPEGLSAEEPAVQDALEPEAAALRGKRVFQYTLTAGAEGQYEIPAIAFSFFNPATARYQTASTAPQLLEVISAGASARAIPGVAGSLSGWALPAAGILLLLVLLLAVLLRRKKRPASPAQKPAVAQEAPAAQRPVPAPKAMWPEPVAATMPPPSSLKEILPQLRRGLDARFGDGTGYLPDDGLRQRLETAGWAAYDAIATPRLLRDIESTLYGGVPGSGDDLLAEAQLLWKRLYADS